MGMKQVDRAHIYPEVKSSKQIQQRKYFQLDVYFKYSDNKCQNLSKNSLSTIILESISKCLISSLIYQVFLSPLVKPCLVVKKFLTYALTLCSADAAKGCTMTFQSRRY